VLTVGSYRWVVGLDAVPRSLWAALYPFAKVTLLVLGRPAIALLRMRDIAGSGGRFHGVMFVNSMLWGAGILLVWTLWQESRTPGVSIVR
jgi:hypothetical protein